MMTYPPLKIAHELKYQNLDRYILTTVDIISWFFFLGSGREWSEKQGQSQNQTSPIFIVQLIQVNFNKGATVGKTKCDT